MDALKKLGRWLALGTMLLVGLVASLFITACGGRGEKKPAPEPPQPPKQEAPKKAQPDTAAPADKAQPKPETQEPPKAKVDRKEVEKGQPLPRNYLE
jgi:hypothetical protein